jgi:hypothetical protein
VSRSIKATLIVAALAAVAVLGLGGPAQARSYDGLCESGEVCLYWGYDYQGGVADFYNDIYNYKSFRFKGSGLRARGWVVPQRQRRLGAQQGPVL